MTIDPDVWQAVAVSVAHDLNNALAGLLPGTEYLDQTARRSGGTPLADDELAELDGAAADVRTSLTRVRALAADLRLLGAAPASKAPLADVGTCVRAAVRLLAGTLGDGGSVEVHDAPGAMVQMSPGQLLMALLQLLHAIGRQVAGAKEDRHITLARDAGTARLQIATAVGQPTASDALPRALAMFATLGVPATVQRTETGQVLELEFTLRALGRR